MDLVALFESSANTRASGEARTALAELLDLLFATGRSAWPDLHVSPETFTRALAAHAQSEASPAPVTSPAHAADFYLAVACAEGVAGAAEALRRTVLVNVPSYVGSRAPADEVEQLVAIRLLLADGDAAPKIAEYSGKGALGAWVRVVATRIALNLQRKRPARNDLALLPFGTAPEIDLTRFQYRDEFKSAFESALALLEPSERLLLRLHAVERMRGDDIARLLEVDRSTIMRRLSRARERLFDLTRSEMMDKLRLTKQEFESIARDVQSGIDLTLSRVLG